MTREEAIRKLQKQKSEYLDEWVDFSGVAEAYDMAIEALSVEIDVHDLVHRNAVKPKLVDCSCFLLWLLDEVMNEDDWELNAAAKGEIICRKLKKLGLLKVKDGYYVRVPSSEAEPTVIRSKTLMPTKDFKEWAKRVREENPNAVIIPCDAEVPSAEGGDAEVNETKSPYMQQSPNNGADLISREDAIDALHKSGLCYDNWLEVRSEIDALPSAEAVQGEWIRVGHDIYECSLCQQNVMTKDIGCYAYCHGCGAKMKGENNESNNSTGYYINESDSY